MANTLAALFKYSTSTVTSNLNNAFFSRIIQPKFVRHLYSKSSMGFDQFLLQCERSKVQLSNIAEKFKLKMDEYSVDDSKTMIFTEDLKNMIHIAETQEDVDLLIKMMKKFNGQNQQLRFGNFVFGPVVMRMLYQLNKADEALAVFKMPELQGFFDQIVSFQLLMDLLYNNERYKEMLEVFDIIKNKQMENAKYPRNVVTLTLAACYKMNTPESLKFALDLWAELNQFGHRPMRRAVTFCAGLALNQGEPATALEIVATTKNQNYTTVRNIKAAAFADLNRADEAIIILKSIIIQDNPENRQQTFNKDVIEKIKKCVDKSDNVELKAEFGNIYKIYNEEGQISEKTLDEQLCVEIDVPFQSLVQKQRVDRYQNYNPSTNRQRNRPVYNNRINNRPGLTELQ